MNFPTGIRELDIKIGIDIKDNILINLCKVNKYVLSICPAIWEDKIKSLYPDLPIPDRNTVKEEYFAISDSYLKLKEFAEYYGYQDILDWLELPINDINIILEFSPLLNANLFKGRGFMRRYEREIEEKLKEYLENDIYPEQRSVDIAFVNKNRFYIIALAKYGIFPNEKLIDKEGKKGIFVAELIPYGLIPSQETVDIATEDGFLGVIPLMNYHIYPSQQAVNRAALNRFNTFIGFLGDENIFPDQKTINIIAENGFSDIVETLAELGKFPDQETINRLEDEEVLDILATYGQYPQ